MDGINFQLGPRLGLEFAQGVDLCLPESRPGRQQSAAVREREGNRHLFKFGLRNFFFIEGLVPDAELSIYFLASKSVKVICNKLWVESG